MCYLQFLLDEHVDDDDDDDDDDDFDELDDDEDDEDDEDDDDVCSRVLAGLCFIVQHKY